MRLRRQRVRMLQRHWQSMARADALWAVLTDPAKTGRRWNREEFYATGRATIAAHMARLAEAAGSEGRGAREGRALDFGCGVGRLTWVLGEYFAEVVGVDLAEEMLNQARAYRTPPGGVSFVLNTRPDLRAWGEDSFDFVYSYLVLQHNPPVLMETFIREFCRVCRPGGYVMFQLPTHRVVPRRPKAWWLWLWPPVWAERAWRAFNRVAAVRGEMEVNVLPAARVRELLRVAGMREVHEWEDSSAGAEYQGILYLARKG